MTVRRHAFLTLRPFEIPPLWELTFSDEELRWDLFVRQEHVAEGLLLLFGWDSDRSRPYFSRAHDTGTAERGDPVHPAELLRDLRWVTGEHEIWLPREQFGVDVFGRHDRKRSSENPLVV
jgi:hypothetical protein